MFLPSRCPVCGRAGPAPCPRCAAQLERAPSLPVPPGLVGCHAVFAYAGPGRELVARVKYRNDRSALAWMAGRMALLVDPTALTVVTWAPTTPAHRRARGFDHAELLARRVGRLLRRPVRPLLVREPGPAQTGRGRAERVRGPRFHATRQTPAVRRGRVLLVDDVATTGATLTCAARVLTAAAKAPVVGLVAARTPG